MQNTLVPTQSKTLNLITWFVQAAVAIIFIRAGILKLAGASEMIALYDRIGVGQWFRSLTGTIEVVSALLILTPKFSMIGALLLAGTMVGALFTHVFVIGGNPTLPLVLFVGALFVAYERRVQLAGYLKNRRPNPGEL